MNNELNEGIAVYSSIIGIIYVMVGLAAMSNSLGLSEFNYIPTDLFGGLMLIFIGGIFLRTIKETGKEQYNGLSFLLVGIIMAVIYSGLYIAALGADALSFVLGSEDFEEWAPLNDFRIEIWLPLITIPGMLVLKDKVRALLNR